MVETIMVPIWVYVKLPYNYAMQRTGVDKVPGRGRIASALIQVSRPREPMRQRAVADGER